MNIFKKAVSRVIAGAACCMLSMNAAFAFFLDGCDLWKICKPSDGYGFPQKVIMRVDDKCWKICDPSDGYGFPQKVIMAVPDSEDSAKKAGPLSKA